MPAAPHSRTSVRHQKGGDLQFINVLDNIQRKVADAATLYHKYRVPQAFKHLIKKHPGGGTVVEGMGTIVKWVPEELDLERLRKAAAKKLKAAGADPHLLDDVIQDHSLTFRQERLATTELDAMRIIPFRDNGQLEYFQLNDELFRAMKGMDETPPDDLVKIAAIPATLARAGSVLSPVFMGRNFLGDIPDAVLFSKHGFMPWHVIAGLAHVLKRDEQFRAFMFNGGMTMTQTAIDKNIKRNTELRLGAKPTLWEKTGKPVLNAIQAVGDVIEWAPRVWEHAKELESGGSAEAAANAANDVTLPHGYSGRLTKGYNRITPFSGSAVRALDRLARAIKENPWGTLAKSLILFGIPAAVLAIINMSDPHYEALPEYRKTNSWCVPVGDGVFLFLPKRSTPAVMLGAGVESTLKAVYKDDPSALREFKDAAASQLPSLMPTFLAWPFIWKNIDPYTGAAIVPAGEENLPTGMQYSVTTTETAKAIGRFFNIAPRKVDAFIKQQTGGLGNLLNQAASGTIKLAKRDNAPKLGMRLNDIPIVKDFLTTPEYGSEDVDEFYRTYQRLNTTNAAINANIAGRKNELALKTKQGREWAEKWPVYKDVEAQMRNLRQVRTQIENTEADPKKKRDAIYKINIAIINLARVANGKKELVTPTGTGK